MVAEYGRLTLLNMSIHHIDSFRYLFGEAKSIYVSVRKDPRTQFAHEDGICLYIMEYANGCALQPGMTFGRDPACEETISNRTSNGALKARTVWPRERSAGPNIRIARRVH